LIFFFKQNTYLGIRRGSATSIDVDPNLLVSPKKQQQPMFPKKSLGTFSLFKAVAMLRHGKVAP